MSSKNKKDKGSNETTGLTGTLETAKDWISESDGTKVQNPNQNKEIHKQALGPNARR
ncbi:MAG: hypothetical protein FWC92_04800 [Defluviitaleaceae bacterium]|nr:hypothetical protein [Defluviitaleaceae bacterium]